MKMRVISRVEDKKLQGNNNLKKSPKDFDQLEIEFFDNAKKKNLSKNLTNYVWNVLIMTQRGYGFNKAHTLSYSIVGLQELNLAYKYPIIYWNAANLIVDSGSMDEDSNDSTKYDKMGTAIANIQKAGVHIEFPLINSANFGFYPDVQNDQIIFGLKGVNGINTELTQMIISNRPYNSINDFAEKMLDTGIITTSKMVKLIKAGCFTELHSKNRSETMEWYLNNYVVNSVSKLSITHVKKLNEAGLIPDALKQALNVYFLKQYILDDEGLYQLYIDPDKKPLKRGYHDRYYILDNEAQERYYNYFTDDCIVDVVNEHYVVSEKKIVKESETYLSALREWLNSPDTLNKYNYCLFLDAWEKYATGSPAKWSMEALCYYDGDHELKDVNESLYGIVDYNKLPEQPEAYEWYPKYINGEKKMMPKYKISRIAGTVLMADNNHHTVALLTKYGLVNVKMNKGHYSFYSKRISVPDGKGGKTVIENSWLTRGNLLLISGIRRDDQFWPMIYNDTIYKHTVNLIKNVNSDGSLALQIERTKI